MIRIKLIHGYKVRANRNHNGSQKIRNIGYLKILTKC